MIPTRDVLLKEFESYQVDELEHSPRTAKMYEYGIAAVERTVGKEITDVTADDLRLVKRADRYSRSTRMSMIVAVRQFHAWGALEGYWDLNGIMAVKTPRVKKRPLPPMVPDQALLLIGGCRTPLDYRVVYFGLYAGCRVHESALLSEEHVRGDKFVFVGKGNKERIVPIHNLIRSHLDMIFSAPPKSAGVLQSNLARLRERTGAVNEAGSAASSHTLRRTFANTLYNRFRVPKEVVGALLGHAADTTDLYAPVGEDRLREAIDKLTYVTGKRRNQRMVATLLQGYSENAGKTPLLAGGGR